MWYSSEFLVEMFFSVFKYLTILGRHTVSTKREGEKGTSQGQSFEHPTPFSGDSRKFVRKSIPYRVYYSTIL